MAVLYIRDENGNFVPIPALKGESAYEQAKAGGYQGTQEEFIAFLNGLLNPVSAIGDEPTHADDKNNPHGVTAKQVGAVPEVYYVSTDLNTELLEGGSKMTVCCYNGATLNTPYKEGLTIFAHGMVITNAHTSEYGTQVCVPTGDNHIYVRRLNGEGVSAWSQVANMADVSPLTPKVSTLESQVAELQTGLASALSHSMKVASGSYRGTGECGINKPNKLTFDFVPLFVIVAKRGEGNATNGSTFIWINPGTTLNFINNGSTYWCHPTLEGTTLSWYCAESSAYQMNSSSYDYDYFAFGMRSGE